MYENVVKLGSKRVDSEDILNRKELSNVKERQSERSPENINV